MKAKMNYSRNKQEHKHRIMSYGIIVLLLLWLFVIFFFVGCKSQQLPTLPNSSDRSHDSIRTEYVHDSVYIDRWHKEIQKGDTFYIHDSIDRWRNKYVYIYDSIDNSRIDTIYKAVEIEKKGSAFLRNSGIALWVIIALIIAGVVIGIILKFAK